MAPAGGTWARLLRWRQVCPRPGHRPCLYLSPQVRVCPDHAVTSLPWTSITRWPRRCRLLRSRPPTRRTPCRCTSPPAPINYRLAEQQPLLRQPAPRPGTRAWAQRGHAAQLRQLLPHGGAGPRAGALRAGRQPGKPARQPLPSPEDGEYETTQGALPRRRRGRRPAARPEDVGGASALAPLAPQRAGGATRTRGAGLAVAEQRLGRRLGLGLGRQRGTTRTGAGTRHAFPQPAPRRTTRCAPRLAPPLLAADSWGLLLSLVATARGPAADTARAAPQKASRTQGPSGPPRPSASPTHCL